MQPPFRFCDDIVASEYAALSYGDTDVHGEKQGRGTQMNADQKG